MNGRPVQEKDVITRSEAEAIFTQEVIQQEGYLRKNVDLNKVNENQYAILISLTYNAGIGNLKSTRILPAINSGKSPSEVSAIIKDSLTTSRGVVVGGLVRRRKEESEFFLIPPIIRENKGAITIGLLLIGFGIGAYFYFKKKK